MSLKPLLGRQARPYSDQLNLPSQYIRNRIRREKYAHSARNIMAPGYRKKLTLLEKAVYRKSDAISAVRAPGSAALRPLAGALQNALKDEDREMIEDLCQKIATALIRILKAPPVRVRVLAARPTGTWGELHGLYVPARNGTSAVITVWMRTAQRKKVVAFRSFFRTLLHEFCHHLDYEHFGLDDSFHTDGFYKRESSLFYQIVGKPQTAGKKTEKDKAGLRAGRAETGRATSRV